VKPYLAKDFIRHEDDEEVFGAYVGTKFLSFPHRDISLAAA
jgi:hypothetical protein